MSKNVPELFVEQLRKEGLSDEDIALIAENHMLAESAAATLGRLCSRARSAVRQDYDQNAVDFRADIRQAWLILDKSVSSYEVRIFAALIKLTRENPGRIPTMADVARILGVRPQAVSKALRSRKIDFAQLKRLVP